MYDFTRYIHMHLNTHVRFHTPHTHSFAYTCTISHATHTFICIIHACHTSRCDLHSFFEINCNSEYNAVVLHKPNSLYSADIALLLGKKGVDACILHLQFSSLSTLSSTQAKSCFTTPDSFSTNANFPLRNSWSDLQRGLFLGSEKLSSGLQRTAEGVLVTNAQRVLSQNSLSSIDLSVDSAASGNDLRMQLFATGDPGANTHWLKQIRIAVHIDGDGNCRSVTSQSRHSQEVRTSVVTYHKCDRKSCLGCNTLKLQSLCYAAQQCAVTSCIGTIVNQNRPLCNAGLVLKSYTEGTLSMVLGAWLIFTETYTTILDAALLGPPKSTNIEWVEDAFFGYICSAKVSVLG